MNRFTLVHNVEAVSWVLQAASSQKRIVHLKLSHGRLERNIVNFETDLSDCQNVFILFITAERGAKVNLF